MAKKQAPKKKAVKKKPKQKRRNTFSIHQDNKQFRQQNEVAKDFWNARATEAEEGDKIPRVGRPRILKTPQQLWRGAVEYFEYQSQQVWNKIDYKGTFAERVSIPTKAPFSLEGLCLFLGLNEKYWFHIKKTIEKDEDEDLKNEFTNIFTRVEAIVFKQQYEGATTGHYNAAIVGRKLGLADKKEITTTEQPLFTDDK